LILVVDSFSYLLYVDMLPHDGSQAK